MGRKRKRAQKPRANHGRDDLGFYADSGDEDSSSSEVVDLQAEREREEVRTELDFFRTNPLASYFFAFYDDTCYYDYFKTLRMLFLAAGGYKKSLSCIEICPDTDSLFFFSFFGLSSILFSFSALQMSTGSVFGLISIVEFLLLSLSAELKIVAGPAAPEKAFF